MKAWLFPICFLFALTGCNKGEHDHDHGPKEGNNLTKGKLLIEDTKVGTGATAAKGDALYMVYTGTLTDGTEFDSNDKQIIEPFAFQLGSHMVIKGWDDGLVGMKVGGERKLTIPYEMAYGEKGQPPKIPAKAELIFKVRLLDILKKGDEMVVERTAVKEGTGPEAKKGDTVTVTFVGTLPGGKVFETVDDKKPFKFKIGAEQAVPGFEAGVTGMKVGGERKLRIGPMAGFGPGGMPPLIPANSILYFDVKLVKIN